MRIWIGLLVIRQMLRWCKQTRHQNKKSIFLLDFTIVLACALNFPALQEKGSQENLPRCCNRGLQTLYAGFVIALGILNVSFYILWVLLVWTNRTAVLCPSFVTELSEIDASSDGSEQPISPCSTLLFGSWTFHLWFLWHRMHHTSQPSIAFRRQRGYNASSLEQSAKGNFEIHQSATPRRAFSLESLIKWCEIN